MLYKITNTSNTNIILEPPSLLFPGKSITREYPPGIFPKRVLNYQKHKMVEVCPISNKVKDRRVKNNTIIEDLPDLKLDIKQVAIGNVVEELANYEILKEDTAVVEALVDETEIYRRITPFYTETDNPEINKLLDEIHSKLLLVSKKGMTRILMGKRRDLVFKLGTHLQLRNAALETKVDLVEKIIKKLYDKSQH